MTNDQLLAKQKYLNVSSVLSLEAAFFFFLFGERQTHPDAKVEVNSGLISVSCEYRLIVSDNSYHRLISLHRPLKPNHYHLNIIILIIKLPLTAAYPTSPFVLLVNTEQNKCCNSLHDIITFNYTLPLFKTKKKICGS